MRRICRLKRWTSALWELFFPHCCAVCGRSLALSEEGICLYCLCQLPRINYIDFSANEVAKRFWGRVDVERALSFFRYEKGSDFDKIFFQIKYHGATRLGVTMGKMMAEELVRKGFFVGIDYLIPIPLHPKRMKQRGYNQSECIAQGLSEVTKIPICTSLVKRAVANETQTHKNAMERWENVAHVFQLSAPPSLMAGKHLLLIDDVLTTGATISSCALVLQAIPHIQISVLTLATVQ
ncbi:MAG: ComF family protein [Bacteroidaceae bacterium]|nr:ComF family protein [Bacteroidaceae bacterium]